VLALFLAGIAPGVAPASARQGVPAAIPILLYHHIDPTPGEYAVTPEQLETQLAWLNANGYVAITPSQLLAAIAGWGELPANPVMLTVDDGWASQSLFVEAVNRYGMRASYFLPNYAAFSPDQIRALHASGEVCGHTVNHANLAQLPREEQVREITDNKLWLEGIVGGPITCFAYPFGSYTDETVQLVIDAGYQIAFTAWGGPAPLDGSLNPFRVQRINVAGSYGVDQLAGIMHAGAW
jgi:peptidoglycan/xylan/chitin deacetylase (PgdA/CDA1 family)